MLKFIAVLALAALCAGQKSTDIMKLEPGATVLAETTEQYNARMPDERLTGIPIPEPAWLTDDSWNSGNLEIRPPLPTEVAHGGMTTEFEKLPGEIMEYPAPSVGVSAPLVNLVKEGREVVDVPHSDIRLPGNSIQSKDLHLNLPSPVVEAPKPIVETKDVLFRLPQPVFLVPKPIVQHKPIVYKVGHTVRPLNTKVNIRDYLFKVPEIKVPGKSAYTQLNPWD